MPAWDDGFMVGSVVRLKRLRTCIGVIVDRTKAGKRVAVPDSRGRYLVRWGSGKARWSNLVTLVQ